MGGPGSPRTGLARKVTGNWDISSEGAGFCDSAVLSIRRVIDSNCKYAHVGCKLVTSLRPYLVAYEHRSFLGSKDDPDGSASPLQFACSLDSAPAFMSYLFGKSEWPLRGLLVRVEDSSTSAMTDVSKLSELFGCSMPN